VVVLRGKLERTRGVEAVQSMIRLHCHNVPAIAVLFRGSQHLMDDPITSRLRNSGGSP